MLYFDIIKAKTFIHGQLELQKIRFIETTDNKYLDNMNEFNKMYETFKSMDATILRLANEKRILNERLVILEKIQNET